MREGNSGTAEWVERFRAAQRSMDVHLPLAEI
jgi:hypothetical protein